MDFHDGDLRALQRLLAPGEDTVDEIGLGPVADAIADALYPGTSVIMTHPRYLFFVSSIYRHLEKHRVSSVSFLGERKLREDRLREWLETSYAGDEETRGLIIGRRARDQLKRYPSSIYWRSLRVLGILQRDVSERAYVDRLDGEYDREGGLETDDRKHEYSEQNAPAWNPKAPHLGQLVSGLEAGARSNRPRKAIGFDLGRPEAQYLFEAFTQRFPGSLLSHRLLARQKSKEGEWPWSGELSAQGNHATGAKRLEALLAHAECMSAMSHGATLQYFDMLLERRAEAGLGPLRDKVQRAFSIWWRSATPLLREWRVEQMHDDIRAVDARAIIRAWARDRDFLSEWKRLIVKSGSGREALLSPDARKLLEQRDEARRRPRLTPGSALLASWDPDAAERALALRTYRLWFRHQVGTRFINAILDGLRRKSHR